MCRVCDEFGKSDRCPSCGREDSTPEVFRCEYCGEEFDEEDLVIHKGHLCCPDCYEFELREDRAKAVDAASNNIVFLSLKAMGLF
jgi:hypothetical protein